LINLEKSGNIAGLFGKSEQKTINKDIPIEELHSELNGNPIAVKFLYRVLCFLVSVVGASPMERSKIYKSCRDRLRVVGAFFWNDDSNREMTIALTLRCRDRFLP
jgi:hypothetical protein